MTHQLYDAMKKRRTVYALDNSSPIPDEEIRKIVEYSLVHTPSAFNSQTGRIVLLLGNQHDELWDITEEALRKVVAEDQFASTKEKINAFRAAYGTLLFFEDFEVIRQLQTAYPAFSDNFPIWALQSSGMLQNTIWSAFAVEGLGASIQHYNELIDDQVKKRWNIPSEWRMMTQMPFGTPMASPGEKDVMDVSKRFFSFE
ncbi:MAG: nitroreductase family protein [Sphaerochaetaceae bacterium]|nr:nitroreductase family protein [Sphaerochaetaceae bacterium]